jgi:NADPH-dependent glutamate synthase beta subunit-like oxidoreductase
LASTCHVCFHPERVIKNKQIIKNAIQHASLTDDFIKKKKLFFNTLNQNKVAIIGSGPAGLSAAKDLAIKGYSVTIFEASESPGGMLRRCIPEYRLPRKSINFDIERIRDYGIEIKTNMLIGKNLDFKKLSKEFDAVFIATGSYHERILKIQGNELDGIVYALDFLEKANSKKTKVTDKVAVIGGGNVAIDSAITALRLGAKDVVILYRRSENDMSAGLWEIKEAKEKSIKIEALVAPNRIMGKKGKVTGIECVRMNLGKIDQTGRKRPIPIKNSKFVIETQTIIIAIGQSPSTVFLPKTVEISEKSTILVDPLSLKTNLNGIFAGGDAISGSASIMEAIAAGKKAAKSIDNYLRNKPEKSN